MVEWKKFIQKSKSGRPESVPPNGFPAPAVSSVQSTRSDISDGVANLAVSPKPQQNGTSTSSEPPKAQAQAQAQAQAASVSPNHDLLPDDVRDYYYPDLDMDSAKRLLQGKPVGTFLIRHSQCPDAKYTLSIRSEKHVFNVRIFKRLQAESGYHLDAPRHLRKYFPTISDLLRHYSNSPKELIALCAGEDGADERTTFKLMFPLSKSESTLNLAAAAAAPAGGDEDAARSRPVTRQTGGSLKAMVKWL